MILIIDNYDSFTFNLFQAVASVAGPAQQVLVLRNDAASPAQLAELAPTHVLLSPGPGHPADSRLSLEALRTLKQTPILGVCLGHQALALNAGARVGRSPRPTHGRAVAIEHDGSALFRGQPARFMAALYHSLAVERASLPPTLRVSAWTDSGDIMALRHVHQPHYGVQFHPESFLTPSGEALLAAFLDLR